MSVFLGTTFSKPSAANELVHPKLTRTRTGPELTPVYPEMTETLWIFSGSARGWLEYDSVRFHGV
jgi:hypothetical protein